MIGESMFRERRMFERNRNVLKISKDSVFVQICISSTYIAFAICFIFGLKKLETPDFCMQNKIETWVWTLHYNLFLYIKEKTALAFVIETTSKTPLVKKLNTSFQYKPVECLAIHTSSISTLGRSGAIKTYSRE